MCEGRGGLLLSGLQRDDDEDGAPVHSAHAARVAHEVVQYRGELGPHLRKRRRRVRLAGDNRQREDSSYESGYTCGR